MSSFYAYDFIYDGIPSQKFALKIITFEDGGLFNGIGSSEVNIIEQRVLRKSKPYYLGRTQETKLEFPLTFGTYQPISGMERDLISAWLFGRSEYKKLYILQDDLNGAYFNCFMNNPEPLYIGGVNYAFECNVICDSPWAYSSPRSVSGSAIGWNPDGYDKYFTIYNGSSEDEYLYPTIDITVGQVNSPNVGEFNLTNFNDLSGPEVFTVEQSSGKWITFRLPRIFSFNNLQENDCIHIDNDLQIISGSRIGAGPISGLLSKFNKNWFRLLPGINEIGIIFEDENDSSVYYNILWTERMKIGG